MKPADKDADKDADKKLILRKDIELLDRGNALNPLNDFHHRRTTNTPNTLRHTLLYRSTYLTLHCLPHHVSSIYFYFN